MQPLLSVLNQARQHQKAVSHFNASTVEVIWSIVRGAQKVGEPVVIGFSEGERDFIGISEAAALVRSIQKSTGHPIYLNADHTYSLEAVKQVVAASYDSVVFDAAKASFEENLVQTKEVVAYVKSLNPAMLVEAEVGYIGSSSALLDDIPPEAIQDSAVMPSSSQIAKFVQETQVDLIAPAVGNIHGMLKNTANPNLNLPLISQIASTISVPLVLHGGSGISDDQFTAAISSGISLIHINTELRRAWRDHLAQSLAENPNEIAPYKLLKTSAATITDLVADRIKLFSNSR